MTATPDPTTPPTMPKLYSTTHDLERLQQRLSHQLNPTPEPQPMPATRGDSGAKAWRRRWQAWASRCRSAESVIEQIPGVRDIYRLIRALLTIQGSQHRLRLQIVELENRLRHAEHENQRHQQQTRATLEQLQASQQLQAVAVEQLQGKQRLQDASLNQLQARLGQDGACTTTALADWYIDFESAHRGDVTVITQRQQHYLPLFAPLGAAAQAAPVVDLGCGRGEWLELLRNQGYQTLGVDSNPAMVATATSRGLKVHEGDIAEFLATTPDASLAALTAFQVVEHLPLAQLGTLFEQAWRTLQPGGLLLLETPNPENLQVAAYSFWLDPTHQRPLPPPTLLNLAQHFGFIDCRIERSGAWPEAQRPAGLPPALEKLLYCEQDYALVARKPLP